MREYFIHGLLPVQYAVNGFRKYLPRIRFSPGYAAATKIYITLTALLSADDLENTGRFLYDRISVR